MMTTNNFITSVESGEMTDVLGSLDEKMVSEIGFPPEIERIPTMTRNSIGKLRELLTHIPDNHAVPFISPWGVYASMNLSGKDSKSPERRYASRFTHVNIGPTHEDMSVQNMKAIFQKILRAPSPLWEQDRIDQRLQPILDHPVEIVVVNDDSGYIELSKIVHNMLDRHPLLLSIDERYENVTVYRIHVNHEYIDGVPASYYLNQFIGKISSFKNYQEQLTLEQLKKILSDTDNIENSTNSANPYHIESYLLHGELITALRDVHKLVNNNLSKINFDKLSFNTFIQLYLLHFSGVNGNKVIGGTLKFNNDIGRQLEHRSIPGNPTELLKTLLRGDSEGILTAVSPFKKSSGNNRKKISIYSGRDNINEIIRPIANLPYSLQTMINWFSKKAGIAVAASGQVMVSIVPARIGNIVLGGFGGPALTEYQSIAYTVGYVGNQIIIRVKSKEPFIQKK